MFCKNCKGINAMEKEALQVALKTAPRLAQTALLVETSKADSMNITLNSELIQTILEVLQQAEVKCKFSLKYTNYKWHLFFIYKDDEMHKAESIKLGTF